MKLDLASTNYEVYVGPNATAVVSLAKISESEWFYSRLPWRSKEFKVSHCISLALLILLSC